tara:strand:+ start:320 stop:1558 length:1239 start_codon:yes stop_codon:yes gene_type:complete
MPRKPIASNNYDTKVIFRERTYYRENILNPREHKNLIDLWNPIYRDYGKVNLDNQRIRLDTRFMKTLNDDGNQDATTYAVNFVADAWNDLREYCLKATQGPRANIIHPTSIFAEVNPKAQNMWEPLKNSYHDHLRLIFRPFVGDYLQFHKHRKRVNNINDFLEMILSFSKNLKKAVPLTKTGFTESQFGPVNYNGLMIEIDDNKNHARDGAKWDWINDAGFPFWLRGCALHGFLVDRNAPWRIIANLESRKMMEYAEPYGVKSLGEIFDTYYVKTFRDDLDELRNFMYTFYQAYLRFEPYWVDKKFLVNHKRTETTKVFRAPINKDSFFKKYGDLYWMRFWFLLRTEEYGVDFTANEEKSVLRTAFKIEKELDIEAAMSYIVRVLHKKAGRGGPPEKTFIRRDGDRQIIVKS